MGCCQALLRACTPWVTSLACAPWLLRFPMRLQFASQHPCLEEHAFAHVVLPKLCHSILSAVTTSQQLLVRWWSSYPKDILARRVVAPLQSYITIELQARLLLAVFVSAHHSQGS
jgi:hypothetical protein